MEEDAGISGTGPESVEKNAKFTKWTILAAGEGAGRIASLYLTKMPNEAIGERVLLMNSNKADINNELINMEKLMDTPEERNRLQLLRKKNVVYFGEGGAGNDFKQGEEYAKNDFETKLRRPIESLWTAAGDVILDLATMGGGTGNGSIPFIIHKMKHGESVSLQNHIHVAMGIIPYAHEADHRHFNAICGITRLLKYGTDRHQNADMVMFVDNSKIASDLMRNKGLEDVTYPDINLQIIKAIDLMIAPGRQAKGVIDVKDYVRLPSSLNLYHFTPCLSIDNDIDLIPLEVALDDAVENSFVELDPGTAVVAYCIVKIPEKYLGKGEFTEDNVNKVFNEWMERKIIGTVNMVSLTYEKSRKDTFDIMLLLGGFDMSPMIEKSWRKYEKFKKLLKMSNTESVKLSSEELDLIESTFMNYKTHTENVIRELNLEM